MRAYIQLAIVILSLVSFQHALAAPTKNQTKPLDNAAISARIKQHFPDLDNIEVKPSPVKELYEVVAGGAVFYVTKDGRYIFSGDVLDLDNKQNNLTELTRKKARLAGLKAIGEDNMIVFSPAKPKYWVTVFTDVDCGYCRKFQAEIPKINELGIGIRYLAFPRAGLNSPSYEKMAKIWCAKDKQKAMDLASNDKPLNGEVCDNQKIKKEFQFGLTAGVTGTPSMIFEDGTLYPGYLPPEHLLRAVEQVRKENS